MKRLFLSVAILYAVSSSALAADEPGREVVWRVKQLIESRKWQEAEALFTPSATVTGVPSEVPEKRWTKTAAEFLKEKPVWSFSILDSRFSRHGKTATGTVHFRHAHLLIHSTWELVEIEGNWKIDSLRFATRREIPIETEELKRLHGTWSYRGKENELLQAMKLTIDLDRFQLDTTYIGIGIALAPARVVEEKRSGTQIRVNPSANPKTIELKWETETGSGHLRAIYKLDGDQLLLLYRWDGEQYPRNFDDTDMAWGVKLKRE